MIFRDEYFMRRFLFLLWMWFCLPWQPHFWVWRVGGPYTIGQARSTYSARVGLYNGLILVRPVLLEVIQRHPFLPVLWLLLLAFMTYLFVDAINTSTIGYAAMPIGFLFGKKRFHCVIFFSSIRAEPEGDWGCVWPFVCMCGVRLTFNRSGRRCWFWLRGSCLISSSPSFWGLPPYLLI